MPVLLPFIAGAEEISAAPSAESADAAMRMENDLADSFRYADGAPIAQTEVSALSVSADSAWARSDSGYLSSDGGVIAGAVAKGVDVSRWQGAVD